MTQSDTPDRLPQGRNPATEMVRDRRRRACSGWRPARPARERSGRAKRRGPFSPAGPAPAALSCCGAGRTCGLAPVVRRFAEGFALRVEAAACKVSAVLFANGAAAAEIDGMQMPDRAGIMATMFGGAA